MKKSPFPWRPDSHTVWPIQGRPEYGGFRVPERDTGRPLAIEISSFSAAAPGWTAYGRNGKYGV